MEYESALWICTDLKDGHFADQNGADAEVSATCVHVLCVQCTVMLSRHEQNGDICQPCTTCHIVTVKGFQLAPAASPLHVMLSHTMTI